MATDENLQARLGNIESDVHEIRGELKDFRKEVDGDVEQIRKDLAKNTSEFAVYRSRIGGILLAFTLVGAFIKFAWDAVKSHLTWS